MIKYICFCMLVLASVFFAGCQQNKPEQVQSAIETSNKPSIKKEIPTLKEFYFDSYTVIDYFTIEQDSILPLEASALDLDFVVDQYLIKSLIVDQNYLTIVRSDNQRDTYIVERVGNQLLISDNGQKNLLCIIKDNGQKIVLYTSFFDLFGRHKLAKTKALFSEFSYGILPEENLLEEYRFLEHKTGNLTHFSYLFIAKK
ncbi:hypothetical protein ACYSNX_10230 [Myroides sp. LJL115]